MSKSIKIISTFLICTVTLLYTMIPAFARNYMNDTVYSLADYKGLDELPYGENTGVVQIEYANNNYLTIFFDRLSIYTRVDNFYEAPEMVLNDYYWYMTYVKTDGKWDYSFSCVSDNPIYYQLSTKYGSDIHDTFYNQQKYVLVSQPPDNLGQESTAMFCVYECDEYLLSRVVPSDWYIDTSAKIVDGMVVYNRSVYSNVYQIEKPTSLLYKGFPAQGTNVMAVELQVGYDMHYYPTVQYLQDLDMRVTLAYTWQSLVDLKTDVLTELYSVNYWLGEIYSYSANISNQLDVYLPIIDYTLYEILETLKGPEYDSSQGLGSNTEFGDSVGGLMQDTEVPSIGSDSIVTNLGNSFLFIRNMFDRVTADFNLNYVISFLLGLSFIAYVLGRVIKNKMNS